MPDANPNTFSPDCVCHTYDANPPDDPRLPELHNALHHAQQAFKAMTAAQQPDAKVPSQSDYVHYNRDSRDLLASAVQRIDRAITLVENRQI